MTNLRRLRTANPRRPRAAAAALAACRPQPAARSLPRCGISLLEVLISMFVLLFGLMGVAAIFPVGNHYAGRGEQFDRGSALTEAAFADLKARGMLRPELWLYAELPSTGTTTGSFQFIQPAAAGATAGQFNVTGADGPGHAFIIDPLGETLGRSAGLNDLDVFPFAYISNANATGEMSNPLDSSNALNPWPLNTSPPPYGVFGDRWPIRRITLPTTNLTTPTMLPRVAEAIVRLHDDVANELPKENDRPGMQRWATDLNGAPQNEPWRHKLLARQYAGNYSWLATVVPTSLASLQALQPIDSRFGNDLYEVSVAVFNKREAIPAPTSERSIDAVFNPLSERELVISAASNNIDAVDNVAKDIRSRQWIAVAGVHQGTGQFLLKWYQIQSIDDETLEDMNADGTPGGTYAIRRLSLEGPEWPQNSKTNLRAILLPGVISVSTQMLPMESAQ
jgi:hypothetical protein